MNQWDDPYQVADEAAAQIRFRTGIDGADVALVLGSGWSSAVADLGEPVARLELGSLAGFRSPVVAGHGGELVVLRTPSSRVVLVLTGRTHFYEGLGVDAAVHGVRTVASLGVRTLVLTNAAGALVPAWHPGTVVAISDHINLTGATPLTGAKFLDMSRVWTPELIELVRDIDPEIPTGVYVQFRGPSYETPAEVRMARTIGGDLVGMSTALEAIAAVEARMAVLGLSLVTNPAAGVSTEPLSHLDVLAAATDATGRLSALLTGILARLG